MEKTTTLIVAATLSTSAIFSPQKMDSIKPIEMVSAPIEY